MILTDPFTDPFHPYLSYWALVPNGATDGHADELRDFARIHSLPWYPAPGPYPALLLDVIHAREVERILKEQEQLCAG